MQTNNSSPSPVQAPVTPVKTKRTRTSKSYFVPLLWFRHQEVALCQHEHRTLKDAQTCLDSKKQTFDEMAITSNLPKKLKKYYKDLRFFIREVIFKKTWAMCSQLDHNSDGTVKDHWQNRYIDLQFLPSFSFSRDDLPLSELVKVIHLYHEQPRHNSKNRKAMKVINLSTFLSHTHPAYLLMLVQQVNQEVAAIGDVQARAIPAG